MKNDRVMGIEVQVAQLIEDENPIVPRQLPYRSSSEIRAASPPYDKRGYEDTGYEVGGNTTAEPAPTSEKLCVEA